MYVRYFWLYSMGGHAHKNWGVAACFSLELCLETLPQLFHTASIWLTLGQTNLVTLDYILLKKI
jgi:hypothetical protein